MDEEADGRHVPLPFLWGVYGEPPHTCRTLVPFQSHAPAAAGPSPGGRERSVSHKTNRICKHDATSVVITWPSVDFASLAAPRDGRSVSGQHAPCLFAPYTGQTRKVPRFAEFYPETQIIPQRFVGVRSSERRGCFKTDPVSKIAVVSARGRREAAGRWPQGHRTAGDSQKRGQETDDRVSPRVQALPALKTRH